MSPLPPPPLLQFSLSSHLPRSSQVGVNGGQINALFFLPEGAVAPPFPPPQALVRFEGIGHTAVLHGSFLPDSESTRLGMANHGSFLPDSECLCTSTRMPRSLRGRARLAARAAEDERQPGERRPAERS